MSWSSSCKLRDRHSTTSMGKTKAGHYFHCKTVQDRRPKPCNLNFRNPEGNNTIAVIFPSHSDMEGKNYSPAHPCLCSH